MSSAVMSKISGFGEYLAGWDPHREGEVFSPGTLSRATEICMMLTMQGILEQDVHPGKWKFYWPVRLTFQ